MTNLYNWNSFVAGDGVGADRSKFQPPQVINMNLLYLNVNSINGKAEQLRCICETEQLHLFLMGESLTKRREDNANDYRDNMMTICGQDYTWLDNFGPGQRGKVKGEDSGVAILVRNKPGDRDSEYSPMDQLFVEKVKPTQFEFTSLQLVGEPADGSKVEVVCLCVYRFSVKDRWPPTKLHGERFGCELEEMIHVVRKEFPSAHIILTGDFNIDLGDLEDNEASMVLRERLFKMGFLFKNRNNYKVGTYKSGDGVWRCYDFAGISPPKTPGLHEIEMTQVVFDMPQVTDPYSSKFDHHGFKLRLTIRPNLSQMFADMNSPGAHTG